MQILQRGLTLPAPHRSFRVYWLQWVTPMEKLASCPPGKGQPPGFLLLRAAPSGASQCLPPDQSGLSSERYDKL